jgi:hypothetical protein
VTVLGVELIALGLALPAAFAVPVARLALRPRSAATLDVRVCQLPGAVCVALWVLSGISLIAKDGGGLYLLMAGVLVALAASVAGAWSLLTGAEARAELDDGLRDNQIDP